MIQFKPNNKVMIIEHYLNTNELAVFKTGVIKAIINVNGTDQYYIHMDEDIDGFKHDGFKIPKGHGYIAGYKELALIE